MPASTKKKKAHPPARHRKRAELQRQRQAFWSRIGLIALALVIAGGTGYAFLGRDGGGGSTSAPSSLGQAIPIMRTYHLSGVEQAHPAYNSNPPTSGPHTQFLTSWGIHTQPIPPEVQVHNLEDGGVIVHYNCTDCPELVSQLEGIVRPYKEHVILAPYPNMKTTIALTAWGRLDTLEAFDEARVQRFIQTYKGIDHHRR